MTDADFTPGGFVLNMVAVTISLILGYAIAHIKSPLGLSTIVLLVIVLSALGLFKYRAASRHVKGKWLLYTLIMCAVLWVVYVWHPLHYTLPVAMPGIGEWREFSIAVVICLFPFFTPRVEAQRATQWKE